MNWITTTTISLALIFFTSLVGATPTIEIFTGDLGLRSTLYTGAQFYFNPEKKSEIANSVYTNLGRKEFFAASKIGMLLKEISELGYDINLRENAGPNEFLEAIENPKTAMILHEGHGIRHREHRERVAIAFIGDGQLLDSETIKKYLDKKKKSKIVPSKNLLAIYTQACYGGYCNLFYKDKLNLQIADQEVKWLGSYETVSGDNVSELIENLGTFVSQNLKAIDKKLCHQLFP